MLQVEAEVITNAGDGKENLFEYRFKRDYNAADTTWCKATNEEDKRIAITMSKNISMLAELAGKKKVVVTIMTHTNDGRKDIYGYKNYNLADWYRKKTSALAKKSSKNYGKAYKQSPEVVLISQIQKYQDMLRDINNNPQSTRRATQSVPMLRQQNNVSISLMDWYQDLMEKDAMVIVPLVMDKFHSEEWRNMRMNQGAVIKELAKSIWVDAIEEGKKDPLYKNVKLASTGLFEVTEKI